MSEMINKNALFVSIIVIVFLFVISSQIHASLLNNIVDGVKNVLSKEDKNVKNKDFTIESNIELAPDGDINNNNQIDAGDIVRFTYTIINTTDQTYSYATLKTNIDRKQLNFIHSLRGATGLSDEDGTITFNNVRINPREQRIISFDARINYFREDKLISTEPEFVDSDNKPIVKSQKKEVLAKKLSDEEIKKRIEKRGVTVKNSNKQL